MHSEQRKLLHVTLGKNKPTNSGEKVYKHLVDKVFFDALSAAYPLFFNEVGKDEFKKVVCEFVKFGARNPQIWKMPNEFRKFVKNKKKFKEIVFANELLWFEWIEIKLMMKNYHMQIIDEFSYEKSYKLNNSCAIKKLKYRVFEKERFSKEGEYFLLAYYDFKTYGVRFREISQVMYLFLKELKKNGMKKAIDLIVNMSGEKEESVQEFFQESLRELANLKILIRI